MDQHRFEPLREWLIAKRGRQVALAAHVHVRPSVVGGWIKGRRPIPVEHAADIEEFTGGAVSRKSLFPGSWRRIWPELAETHPYQAPPPAVFAGGAIKDEALQPCLTEAGVAHV